MGILDLTIGPILIGVVFNVFLFGTMVMQCYLYFITFKRDKRRIRFLVWMLLVLDTANTIFDIATLYGYTITDFGNHEAVSYGTWRAAMDPALTAVISASVQGFFAWRVHCLVQITWLTVVIYVGIALQALSALGVAIVGSIITAFADWGRWEVKVPIVTWLVFAACVDCTITGSLIWSLQRSRTGLSVTDDLITKLIKMTVQTGLVTAICAVLDLVLYLTLPLYPIHLCFNLPLAKLYSNSLLSALNARLSASTEIVPPSSGNVMTSGNWRDGIAQPTTGLSGIHVATSGSADRDEFELASPAKQKHASTGTISREDDASGNANMDIESSKQGEYALRWS
ncbi:hypothetical protein JAAARDRAFT_36357 [Jaapia argillacea MUCL 33604]|uniref:DUF6534 domain-containing protein n=1 Tax=Jaapia argillacea MUCL 33604 TaxID=933084 RepID=A0A067PQ20_9AGAM|nr:hypothetical protein JAAARDRAFT_36357 [Jaapia argillacea MUCL 33604]